MVTIDHIEENVIRKSPVATPVKEEQPKEEVKRGRKPKED